ncbi:MAG TPA: 30S ribosomal protein S6 [Solirubrobacteraceae bacterium]|nr:30S ribosomal protein S6 [Solirubrobacteraceae bacterium]
MTTGNPLYDLVLLLDPQAPDAARAKIVADARTAIDGDGEVVRADSWGERQLAYPIEKHKSAEYHLVQFHAGSAALLEQLGRTLRITDGVLRYRIIKLRPGVPEAPAMAAAPVEREQPGTPAADAAPVDRERAETPAAAAPDESTPQTAEEPAGA